jgi:hypothetical protein
MLQHVRLLARLTCSLADTHVVPQWLPGSSYAAARLQSLAEGR